MKKVSIIIPVREINDYIREAMNYYEKLDYDNFEILIFSDHVSAEQFPHTKVIASGEVGPADKRDMALRYAEGDVIIGMDDDGQTHPSQLPKLFDALDQGYDLVYGYYPEKKHNWFRNMGSRFNDLTVNLMIKKPGDVRTSSYFVVRKFIRDYSIEYTGSYTYLLGLFMRCTHNIASVPVQHFDREVGESGYTLKQLIRLWSSIIGFSVIPLRVASIAGFFFAGVGLLAALAILIRKFIDPNLSMGWPSLMCAISFFSGLNFMFLGMIGEYLGRMFLGMNKEPQYVIKATYNISRSGNEKEDLL